MFLFQKSHSHSRNPISVFRCTRWWSPSPSPSMARATLKFHISSLEQSHPRRQSLSKVLCSQYSFRVPCQRSPRLQQTRNYNPNCDDCNNCSDCKNCDYCNHCSNCRNCDACDACDDCSNCKNSDSCTGCTRCSNCDACTNCTGCSNCDDCTNCKGCTSCEQCKDCEDCTNCSDCTNCTDCVDCVGLTVAAGERGVNKGNRYDRVRETWLQIHVYMVAKSKW